MSSNIFALMPVIAFLACLWLAWFVDHDEHILTGFVLYGLAALCLYYTAIYGVLSLCTSMTPAGKAAWAVGVPIGLLIALLPLSFMDSSIGMGFISMRIPMAYLWTVPGQILLTPVANGRADKRRAQRELAEFNATPDPDAHDIVTVAQCPYVTVTPEDIAGLPGGKILLSSHITGPKRGTKLAVFSADGRLDPDFDKQCAEYLRHEVVVAPNGTFLLVSDVFLAGWNEDWPAVIRDARGKKVGTFSSQLEQGSSFAALRFRQDGRLYGLIKKEPGTDLLQLDLVEMGLNGKPLQKTALLPALKGKGKFHVRSMRPEDLFFWSEGDVGLIAVANRDRERKSSAYVIRMDREGKRIKAFFVANQAVRQTRYLGFLPDGSLLLGGDGEAGRDYIGLYKDGKGVSTFTETLKVIRTRLKIRAAKVIGSGLIAIAGTLVDDNGTVEVLILDQEGHETSRIVFGRGDNGWGAPAPKNLRN